jgi:hypothetical protein
MWISGSRNVGFGTAISFSSGTETGRYRQKPGEPFHLTRELELKSGKPEPRTLAIVSGSHFRTNSSPLLRFFL